MKEWSFKNQLHFHGKGFFLEWDFPDSWMVLVHFRNGETKPWYRRTERNYRFRRWFLKKGKDRFHNLANFRSPFISLFVFRGFLPLPKKIRIPMEVRLLRVNEPEFSENPEASHQKLPSSENQQQQCRANSPSIHFQLERVEPCIPKPEANISNPYFYPDKIKPPVTELLADFENFKSKQI